MGQLYEIATVFYKLENMTVRILESRNDNPGSTTGPVTLDTKTVFVKYRLDFDNRDYVRINDSVMGYGLNMFKEFSFNLPVSNSIDTVKIYLFGQLDYVLAKAALFALATAHLALTVNLALAWALAIFFVCFLYSVC